MLFFSLIVMIFLQEILGRVYADCNEPLRICPIDTKMIENHLVFMNEMRDFCRDIRLYYPCFDNLKEDFGDSLCGMPLKLSKLRSLYVYLCTDIKRLQRYQQNSQCFEKIEHLFDGCNEFAKQEILRYEEWLKYLKSKEYFEEAYKCMLLSLKITCASKIVKEECSHYAFETFLETIAESAMSNECPFQYKISEDGKIKVKF
ncbi:uncharacterized protein TNIN_5611 [Trichonephila inaurata madagascariensis]|uniref:DUF19 domain-containing protein n=1 Tax=Trichonephila inaurata madagascariensis TaxID=2747483 RepID=A0A8X7CKV9_9ARAC|nr:uncharacterized protein TNIN_5611 [Trichonephila inaurata madagascariensis]